MSRLIGLVAVLLAGFALFYAASVTPPPAPIDASPQAFSATRAMVDIKVMAAEPHPIGSAANHKVRDYLVARMTALGLTPQLQRTDSFEFHAYDGEPYISGGDVENIVAVLPGRDRAAPAVALMAHYDSVRASPGAADDAAGVASALEIVRAMKARGVPARDVMLIITDGEEAGLLGARAFFAENPQAGRIGFLFNMDVRGGGGRARMFQTGADGGGAMALYARTAVSPEANSLSVFVAEHVPNDTDFTIARGKGIAGLNYGFIGRQFDYHSPSATVAVTSAGAVQHLGAEVLGTAMAAAFADHLPARTPDMIFGNALGPWMVVYPQAAGWAVLVLVAGLIGVGAWRAARADAFAWLDLAKGLGAGLLLLMAGALVLHVTRLLTGVDFGYLEQRPLLARFPLFEVGMVAAGLALILLLAGAMAKGRARSPGVIFCLVGGLAWAALGGFSGPAMIGGAVAGCSAALLAWLVLGRPGDLPGAWTGLLLTGLAAGIALQIAAPLTTPGIVWPLLGGALIYAVSGAGAASDRVSRALAVPLAAVMVAFALMLFHGLNQALDIPEAPAVAVWLAAMSLWPLAWPGEDERYAYAPGLLSLGAGLGIALLLHLTSPWSARYPQAVEPLFVIEPAAGKAWRASLTPPARWTSDMLKAGGEAIQSRPFDGVNRNLWAAPAAPVAAEPPAITVTRAADGLVTLHAPLTADTLRLTVKIKCDTLATAVTLNGKPVAILSKPGQWSHLVWQAAPEGFTVSFRPVGPGALDIQYAEVRAGWPAAAKPLPAVPSDVMLWDIAGSTVISGAMRRTW